MDNLRIPISYREWAPPVYYCRRADKPFVLDGDIRKDFWADAPFTDAFLDIEGEQMPAPRYRTRVKMLWDDENLYFGALLEGDEIWATLTERDCVIFQDNDFEIFLDPDSDTHQYFEFEMNAQNTVWDLFLTKPYRDFGGRPLNGWDIHGLQTAVKIDGTLNQAGTQNKCWMAEVVIPFKALREMAPHTALPTVGDYYRVNFSRVHWDVDWKDGRYQKKTDPKTGHPLPENNWVWAPTGLINIHYPEHWGFVFFTENGEEYPIPESEKLKWELRKVYYLEQRHFDRHGVYAKTLEEMELDLPITIQPEIQVADRKFQLSCVTKSGSERVYLYEDGKTEVLTREQLEEEKRRPSAALKAECTPEEYGYVEFLYRNMPLTDLESQDDSYFLEAVRQALKARKTAPWSEQLTDELFLNFVLPYRINNENMVRFQKPFYETLHPLIENLDLEQAAITVNYWCMSQAVYQATNERTGSPFTVINNAFGRCGEESTLTVAALRSVGIPARQCYTPRWSHCDDNHAWVEVYTERGWRYLGACEPESRLDTGWFRLPASKAMLVHTRAFSDFAVSEPLVQEEKGRQEINALQHYADTSLLTVQVQDGKGQPVQEAQVDFEVVNYSEFYPIATLNTDQDGKACFLTGKGDLLLHVSKDGLYVHEHVDVRQCQQVKIDFSKAVSSEEKGYQLVFVPPVGGVEELPALTAEQEALEKSRQQKSNQTREQRIAHFPTKEEEKALEKELGLDPLEGVLEGAHGNAEKIERFLRGCAPQERPLAVRLLKTLLQKDLSDISEETLRAHLDRGLVQQERAAEQGIPEQIFDRWVLAPRIGIEFITPFHQDVEKVLNEADRQRFSRHPEKAAEWVEDHILLMKDTPAPIMRAAPGAVLRLGMGNQDSRKILTVALLRTCGIPARLEESDGCIAYWKDGDFVRWERAVQTKADAFLQLRRQEKSTWEYYKNVTIGRLRDGRYQTLDFGSLLWENDVLRCPIEPGRYRIITTDRQPDESNPVHVDFVQIESGQELDYALPEMAGQASHKEVKLKNRKLIDRDGSVQMLHQVIGENGKRAVCWLGVGAEPTEHLLNELIENAERFTALESGVVLLVRSEQECGYKTLAKAANQIPNLKIMVDADIDLDELRKGCDLFGQELPLILIGTKDTAHYAFSGYQVGIGEMMLKCLKTEKI